MLGYDNGEINSNSTEFYLVDWKQAYQNDAGDIGLAGLAISHVTNAASGNFWNHSNGVTEIARATNLGSTGWADNTEYAFMSYSPAI